MTQAVAELAPAFAGDAFVHARRHDVYFTPSVEGPDPSHPALRRFETSNQTVCADRMGDGVVVRLYEWPPFAQFLAAVMERPVPCTMEDRLARVNVMSHHAGQALNWHFDRAEFTTTLLLQAPERGGVFGYDRDLRSDADPNHDGVADLLAGRRTPVHMPLTAGTLNISEGRNTAHRVTPVDGSRARMIAVFSCYERPGVNFSDGERTGYYGRAS